VMTATAFGFIAFPSVVSVPSNSPHSECVVYTTNIWIAAAGRAVSCAERR
jgi:hypothetical protein